MKKKIGWLLFSLLLITAMVLTSCNEAPVTTTPKEPIVVKGKITYPTSIIPVVPPATGAEMVQTSIPGKKVEKPQYGGTYITCSATDYTGFDPVVSSAAQYLACPDSSTNEPLAAGDWSKGPAGSNNVTWEIAGMTFLQYTTGRIAESWEVPDDQTIIFNIRKGIHFQNKPPVSGRECDAEDVVFSLKRNFETAGAYLNSTYKGADAPLSIKATSQWTVEIKTNVGKQGPLFIAMLGFCNIFPRDGAATEGSNKGTFKDWKTSCGTGPFLLSDYVPNSSVTYVKNPDFWMTDPLIPGNKLPYVDKVLRLVIPDEAMRVTALKTGKIDAYQGITWDVAEALHKTNPDLFMGQYLSPTSNSIQMKLGQGFPWDNIKVRYALSMATDRAKIKDVFYGGNAVDFTFPIMPFPELEAMFTPFSELPQTTQDLYKYDVTKAKQLMAEAGQSAGFTADILVSSASQVQQDLLQLIKDMWKEINVTVNVVPKEYTVYTSELNSKAFKHMILCYDGTQAPYKMTNWRVNSINAGSIDSPQLIDVYNQVNTLYPFKEAEAQKLIKAQTPYILEQCWQITPPQPYIFYFFQPWLKNYNCELSVGYYQTENGSTFRWIDQKVKAAKKK